MSLRTGLSLYSVALLGVAGSCAPMPLDLLAQLQGLEQLAIAANRANVAGCARPAVDAASACAELLACLSQVKSAAGTCQQAIQHGRTNQDRAYALEARACVAAKQAALRVCPAITNYDMGVNRDL